VAGELVYFGTGDGQVIARDVRTGAPRWAAKVTNDAVDGANLVARAGVVVAPIVLSTVGLDAATGRELWRYRAPPDTALGSLGLPGQVVLTRIDADEETVYIPAWGASVSAVDLQTGVLRWVWQPGQAPTDTAAAGRFRSGSMGVRVSGESVFATAWHYLTELGGRSEAWVIALDRATGRERWRAVLPVGGQGVLIDGAPAVYGNLVIATARAGETYALDGATGAIVWQFAASGRTPSTQAQPEMYGDAVYIDGGDHHIYALRASDGAVLWRAAIETQATTDLLVTERRVVFPEGRYLNVLDRRTGRQLARVTQPRTTEPLFASPAAYTDGRVFITMNNAAWSFDEP
jgi:outer membrane protein assembly factor BamB